MAQKTAPNVNENAIASIDMERARIAQSAFSGFSHDLKTPLACIIGALEIYERMGDKLPCEKKHVLINTALQEAHKLNGLISTMLDNVAPE